VRSALGAPRRRLIRQMLTESTLLAAFGGLLGLLLAYWGTHVLISLSPANIPRVESISLDFRALFFLFGVTLLTSVGFGLAPAIQSTDVSLNDTLKETGRSAADSHRGNRLRGVLIASEFALALLLLVGAGLMIRSFFALLSIDPGFNPHQVLSMTVSVAGSSEAPSGRRELFYHQLLDRVRALPGVESVGGINHVPLAGDVWGRSFLIEGRPQPRPGEEPGAVYRIATPGYFHTMRLPLIRGRDFSAADSATAPAAVIINQRVAHEYWRDEDPLGKRISLLDTEKSGLPQWFTIIGLVKDAKQQDWAAEPSPEIYLDAFQNPDFLGTSHSAISNFYAYITLVVRAVGDPAALTATIKKAVWSFDRNLPISNITTMDAAVSDANAQPRFEMLLLGIFAAVALALAAAGIYGVMSYSVSRRIQEIGIRVSLGATRVDVLRLVFRQGMRLALAGLGMGAITAFALSGAMTRLVYGIKPTDPVTFVVVTILLLAIAILAIYFPARRATKVDPMVALRAE